VEEDFNVPKEGRVLMHPRNVMPKLEHKENLKNGECENL
jgi:hypothetical protein